LILTGRQAEVRVIFERILNLRNDMSLLAEEYDPRARRQMGNVPQVESVSLSRQGSSSKVVEFGG
jgi:GH15 family glucan-1,4-alpha-glucosidase